MCRSATKHVIRNGCAGRFTCTANGCNLITSAICSVVEECYAIFGVEFSYTGWAEPSTTTNNSCGVVFNKCVINVDNIRNRSNVNCATLIVCSVINNFASIKSYISRCNINTSTNALIAKLISTVTSSLILFNRTTVHGKTSAVNIWPVIPWSTNPGVRNLLSSNNAYKLIVCCYTATSNTSGIVLDNTVVHDNVAVPSYVDTATGLRSNIISNRATVEGKVCLRLRIIKVRITCVNVDTSAINSLIVSDISTTHSGCCCLTVWIQGIEH